MTKLDGTAKGGVVLAIAQKLGLPIRFVGVGEQDRGLRRVQCLGIRVSALLKTGTEEGEDT